jgi:PAS domain S-box-containing protein
MSDRDDHGDEPASNPRLEAEFLDSIVENIPNMIFLKDARELRFVRFNRAGEELLGYSSAELIGKNDYDFFPEEEADFFTQKDREVLDGKKMVDIPEEPIHTRYRGTRILHTKKIPILGHDGEPLYLLGISEDITDKKDLEAERRRREELEEAKRASDLFADRLRRSEARLASMIQGIPDGIAVVDAGGAVLDVNASAIEIVGASDRSELIGPAERLLSRILLQGGDAAKTASWDAIRLRTRDGESSSQEGQIDRPDEPSVAVVLMAFPLEHGPEGQWTLLVIRDVTEQKRLESLRDEFLSIAAHELKTPLATIKGYAELLPSWSPEEMAVRGPAALAAIQRQCGRLNRLVQELLEVSRLQLGRLALQLRSIDLEPLVRQVVAELRPAARANRLTMTKSESLRVGADPDRLE